MLELIYLILFHQIRKNEDNQGIGILLANLTRGPICYIED